MLGSASSKTLIREGYSLSVNPKITAEWNHNLYNRPRICGSIVNNGITQSNPILANTVTAVANGATFISSPRSANNINSKSFTQTVAITSTDSLYFPANKSFAYKISFFAKTTNTAINDFIMQFTEKSYDGSNTATTGGSSRKFHVDTLDYTFHQFIYSPSDELSNRVYLSLIAESSSSITISDLTICEVEKYEYKINHLFQVEEVFKGFRAGDELAELGTDRTLTDVIYRSIEDKDAVKQYSNTNALRNSSGIVTLTIGSHTIFAGDYVVISGVSTNDFNGRFYVQSVTSTTISYYDPGTVVTSGTTDGIVKVIQCTDAGVSTKIVANSQNGSGKIYAPGIDKLKYYISPLSNDQVASGIFAYYDKSLTTNKIVIKMLNSGNTEMNTAYSNIIVSYTLHTYNASTSTWTSYSNPGTTLNKNGSLILYWDGTSAWDTTPRSSTINESTYTLTGTTSIDGIALEIDSIGYRISSTNYTLNTTNQSVLNSVSNYVDQTVRFFEVSPRLVVDLSSYTIDFSSAKETDSSNLPIAVGLATSNNSTITLDNITRVNGGGTTFSIFSDKSGISPFSRLDLIQKDIKFRIKYDLINSAGSTVESNIPFFTGFVERWEIQDDVASITLFDESKYLQKKPARDLLILGKSKSISIGDILIEIFEQNGFTNYYVPTKTNNIYDVPELNTVLNNFYTDQEKTIWENIQELFIPYSLIGYFDEYGMFKVTSHLSESTQASADFVFTDTSGTYDTLNYLPNIIGLTEEKSDKPGRVSVLYDRLFQSVSPDSSKDDIKNQISTYTTALQPLWEAPKDSSLGYAELLSSITNIDNRIELNFVAGAGREEKSWNSYSGYAVIGSEIIRYDGKEYSYVSGATGLPVTKTIRSPQELQAFYANAVASNAAGNRFQVKIKPTGYITNVERGMFGTKAQPHLVMTDVTSLTTAYPTLSVNVKTGTSAPSSTELKTTNLKRVKNNSLDVLNLYGASSAQEAKTILYFKGEDKQHYSKYLFQFDTAHSISSSIKDDIIGIVLGYDNVTGDGLYLELVAETSNVKSSIHKLLKTTLYQNGVALATSKFTLDTYDPPKTKPNPKSTKKKPLARKVVKNAVYDKMQSVLVSINSKNEISVKINSKAVEFLSTSGKKIDPVVKFDRISKSIGMYVKGKNAVNIHTISAWKNGSFMISPEHQDLISVPEILAGGQIDSITPFYFTINPSAYGMEVFDINFTSGPSWNQEVFRAVGGFTIGNGTKTKFVPVKESQSLISDLYSTPFRAKFAYINKGQTYIPLNGQDGFFAAQISGNVLIKTDEAKYTKSLDDTVTNNDEIQMSSDWIQTDGNAKDIAAKLLNGIKLSGDKINLSVFGNPLITVGDVVKLKYYKSNIVSDSYYLVVGLETKYSSGFDTQIVLRKIKE